MSLPLFRGQALIFAPLSNKSFAISYKLQLTANLRAVRPVNSPGPLRTALTLAPCFSIRLTISRFLFSVAIIRAVQPSPFPSGSFITASTSAPWSSNRRTISSRLSLVACIRGVKPFSVVALVSALLARSS